MFMNNIDGLRDQYLDVYNAIEFFSENTELFAETLFLVAKTANNEEDRAKDIKAAARKILYCNLLAEDKFIRKFVDMKDIEDLENLCDAIWAMSYAWADDRCFARLLTTGVMGYSMTDSGYGNGVIVPVF